MKVNDIVLFINDPYKGIIFDIETISKFSFARNWMLVMNSVDRKVRAITVFDYNVVKVVRQMDQKALYFSRQAIPAVRDAPYRKWMDHATYFQHIGIYGYRKDILISLTQLPPSALEKTESLEQLRWLENGYDIVCFETQYNSFGVDTPEDLAKARLLALQKAAVESQG
jgi:CMP-2-keto-3-deoxyoctulosonic acid synthetase